MNIAAEWRPAPPDESAKNAIFLMAGDTCLGYVDPGPEGRYLACIGSGMAAPGVYCGPDLEKAKAAVEAAYK